MIKKIFFIGVLVFIYSNAFALSDYILPKIALILPKDSNIKPYFLVKPVDYNVKQNVDFCIADKPIVSYANRFIFYPQENILVTIKNGFNSFICLSDNIILFSNKDEFGFLSIVEHKNQFLATIERIAKLPLKDSKMFKGIDKTLYFVGFDDKSKLYKVFLFKQTKPYTFKELYAEGEPIESVTGEGEKILVGYGKTIYFVENGQKILYYKHPKYSIKQIIYTAYGVFYATDHTVGFIKNALGMEFVIAPNPKIYLKDNVLYVLFPSNMGILGFKNIDNLKRYNFPIKSIKVKE